MTRCRRAAHSGLVDVDAFIRDGSVLIRGYGRLMPAGNCRCLGIGLASAGWLTGLVCRMVRQLN